MAQPAALVLEHRALIRLSGTDLIDYLQGLVSNDVEKVSPTQAIWSALLTPQGKFLHEFIIADLNGAFLLDCEAARRADLISRLRRYRLRAKVDIEDLAADYLVAACYGPGALAALSLPPQPGHCRPFDGGVAIVDPRRAELGARLFLPRASADETLASNFAAGSLLDYDRARITQGVPDGSRDMEVERSILLENGFDELGGVDWSKGCYIGQELTARTKHRALIKKRLIPVAIEGGAPQEEAEVKKNGKPAGLLRSHADGLGLALLRLERLQEDGPLTAGAATLQPKLPTWLDL